MRHIIVVAHHRYSGVIQYDQPRPYRGRHIVGNDIYGATFNRGAVVITAGVGTALDLYHAQTGVSDYIAALKYAT